MHVIGTAGHVDHGKSSLVQALTGINPDRLKEEQEREMTIDLGFAWLELPGDEPVGIVDVPGHQDFIENMLAGVGGIDAALFVIAADEGIMPQTREHLAILDLLQVPGGVIALNKVDLVDDPEWLEMVETDIRQAVYGTALAGAPLVRVSARTGAGLDELKKTLRQVLERTPRPVNLGRPRLSVDRVFSVRGFGTVVTGTLLDGEFHLGEEVAVLPGGGSARIRGLQSYKQAVELAFPGSRTAINLAGVDTEHIKRGDVICLPGTYRPVNKMDVSVHVLPGLQAPVRHNSEVKIFLGAAEQMARLRLLDAEVLQPGQDGWAQIELSQPLVAGRKDRFILRRPSPGETIAGGVVVDPEPARRHRRFSGPVLEALSALKSGLPEDVLFQAVLTHGAGTVKDCFTASRMPVETAWPALSRLIENRAVVVLPDGGQLTSNSPLTLDSLILTQSELDSLVAQVTTVLKVFHAEFPLKPGMPKEGLRSRLKLPAPAFNALTRLWVNQLVLVEQGNAVRLPGFEVHYSPRQQEMVGRLLARFARSPYAPPSYKECVAEAGETLVESLLDSGRLVTVSPEVLFRDEDLKDMRSEVARMFVERPVITLAEVRDRFGASRRYAQALLEYFDRIGFTLREGDGHRLRR